MMGGTEHSQLRLEIRPRPRQQRIAHRMLLGESVVYPTEDSNRGQRFPSGIQYIQESRVSSSACVDELPEF